MLATETRQFNLGQAAADSGLCSCVPMVAEVQAGGTTYSITAAIELVTPETAESWLARKQINRASSDRRVQAYARAMVAREWAVTNQGAGFDVANRLIDGEHRLRAVILSRTPVLMLVVRGLPPDVQAKVDFNRTRSAADQGLMTAGIDHNRERTSYARVLHLISTAWADQSAVFSPSEKNAWVLKYQREIEWAVATFPSSHPFAPAPVISAWAYAYGATPNIAQWVSQYLDGTGLERGDPLLALRNRLLNRPKRTSIAQRSLVLLALRAIWGRLKNEKLAKLYDTAEGVVGFAAMRGDKATEERWADWTSFERTGGEE